MLFEDAAQAWLAEHDGVAVGSLGDVAVFSLYKTFGLPDGAACRAAAAPSAGEGAAGLRGLLRAQAAWAGERSSAAAWLLARRAAPPYSAERDFALGNPELGASRASRYLLPRVADPFAAARRRANYEALLGDLGELVPPPFGAAPPGSSPFVFPIAGEKDALLPRLAAAGIRPLNLWAVPHRSLPVDRFPRAASLRNSVLGLPVHQELRPGDVERIAAAVRGPRPARTLTLEPIDWDSAGPEWDDLALRSGNVFATREWLQSWWSHFGRDRRLGLRACRAGDGRLVAVLPVYEWRARPLRVLRLVGHTAGDQLGPVCDPAERHLAARGLRDLLAEAHADVFLGEQMPGGEGWSALLGATTLTREGSPVLPFRGRDAEALVGSWSSNLRGQVRGRRRKLEREHELSFRLAATAEDVDRDLAALFVLHRARWHDRATAFSQREAFHRELAQLAFERGWLRLWTLEADGAAVAAWYGFRFGGAEAYYQMGRDPAWDARSVGFVLLTHTILEASGDGMREYRFLRGDEPYKYRFAERDAGLETVAVGRNPVATAAIGGARTARAARRARRKPGA